MPLSILAEIALCYVSTRDAHDSFCSLVVFVSKKAPPKFWRILSFRAHLKVVIVVIASVKIQYLPFQIGLYFKDILCPLPSLISRLLLINRPRFR